MCSTTNTTVTSTIMNNNNTIESLSTPTCQATHYSFCPGCGVDVSQFSHEGSCPYLRLPGERQQYSNTFISTTSIHITSEFDIILY
ncbi:hypothetical protein INT45_008014 [Circinella minor]|uniref:Uncharacterized protein n=1 Tax=Circinella minor TaxID=1195481 RepID=A0A8H7SAR4_9FUNG|nr:hypothetical protein INT45_008014 [Circinella minor]